MSYREFIPDAIRETVASWQLSDGLLRSLWTALRNELRNRDDAQFRRCVAPVRYLILSLSIRDPETNDLRNFAFYIDVTVRPNERTVVEAIDLDKPLGTPTQEAGDSSQAPKPATEF